MTRYPLENITREVAYIAFHFNWSRDEILEMSHRERQSWVNQVAGINKEINETLEDRLRKQ